MDLKTVVLAMVIGLLVVGLLALVLAVHFGKQYQGFGVKKHKYICVSCTVACFVCVVTAVQIFLMFKPIIV